MEDTRKQWLLGARRTGRQIKVLAPRQELCQTRSRLPALPKEVPFVCLPRHKWYKDRTKKGSFGSPAARRTRQKKKTNQQTKKHLTAARHLASTHPRHFTLRKALVAPPAGERYMSDRRSRRFCLRRRHGGRRVRGRNQLKIGFGW